MCLPICAGVHCTAGYCGIAGNVTGAGVTVLVTEDEARGVAYAAAIGEVMLALAPAQTACCGGPPSRVGNLPP